MRGNWKPKKMQEFEVLYILLFHYVYLALCSARQMRRLRRLSADVRPHPLR